MLSRVADSLYWMGRYIERAEHTARLVNVELQLWLDQSPEMGAGAMAVFAGGAERSGGGRAGGPDKTGKHLGIQPEERIIHRFQHLKRRENLRHVREHRARGCGSS